MTRAEKAGCPAVAVTVDSMGGRIQDTQRRLAAHRYARLRAMPRPQPPPANLRRRSMYEGVDLTGTIYPVQRNMTWDFFKRLRDTTRMKILVKGHARARGREDRRRHGAGRRSSCRTTAGAARTAGARRSTRCPRSSKRSDGRIPILIDSGFRRGMDIVKALAMGAQGVCIGRPYIWGLGAFGQPGVERVLELLRVELRAIMKQVGAPTIKHLVPAMVRRA